MADPAAIVSWDTELSLAADAIIIDWHFLQEPLNTLLWLKGWSLNSSFCCYGTLN